MNRMKRYLHIEVDAIQTSKKPDTPCGDVWLAERTTESTTVILADGIGSGVKANICATMAASRLQELLRRGFSLRQAFSSLVRTMHEARGTDLPYAVFSVIRLLNDGEATALTYEMPNPLLLGPQGASIIQQRTFTLESEIIGEANLFLEPGEGLMIMSDGITQAGMGCGLRLGWTSEGVNSFVEDCLNERVPLKHIPQAVHNQARDYWGGTRGDDCSVVLAHCRRGEILNVLTGPPLDRNRDPEFAGLFLGREGRKVVCGATTARIVAKRLGKPLGVDQDTRSAIAPPQYFLDGVDLVTEGAVTLTQVFNILGADPTSFEPDTGVTNLCELLRRADRINFIVGRASNEGHADISFRQRGIIPRTTLVPLLAERLRQDGKLVVVEFV